MPRRKKQSLAVSSAIETVPALSDYLVRAWAAKPPLELRSYLRGLYLLQDPGDPPEVVEEARFLYELCLHR